MSRTRNGIDNIDATILQSDRCLSCGTGAFEPLSERASLLLFQCAACGLVVGRSNVTPAGQAGMVVATDPNHFKLLTTGYRQHRDMTGRLLDARLPVYQRHLGADPAFWLEIGPGNGALADILPTRGCRWTGVEFDPEMASAMLASGKNVVQADFAAVDPATLMTDGERDNGGFDIVTCSQVLEHVLEPRSFLANARMALRPGGLLHLDVPNQDGLTALVRRLNPRASGYGEIVPPHHMIGYGSRALRIALDQAGFEIIDLFSCAYNHPVFGLVHAHLDASPRMKAIWALSKVAGGGNLVALVRKPR